MDFRKFPDIEGFHNVVKLVQNYPHLATGPIKYRGKIKLHGTNAGVRVKDGEVVAQSKYQLITPQSDNMGFAKWTEEKKDFFLRLKGDYTVFGEWCGSGILKGTAINRVPTKQFVVFAVMGKPVTDPSVDDGNENFTEVIVDPQQIADLLGELPCNILILPWFGEEFTVDFTSRESMQKVADSANQVVGEVEPCDPWVKATFGIEGVGEGVVYYPSSGEVILRNRFSNFTFKAKGEKHKVVATKEAVQIDPEVAASVEEFVALFVTEPRLEQGATVVGSFEMKNMGPFLKWFCEDVLKESKAELEASSLTWDQVQKAVQTTARTWFMAKNKTI